LFLNHLKKYQRVVDIHQLQRNPLPLSLIDPPGFMCGNDGASVDVSGCTGWRLRVTENKFATRRNFESWQNEFGTISYTHRNYNSL
jgi:hypothetical protein